jgi:hypothetical protein
MPQTDFAAEILETEIVLTHIGDGHVYHFPIMANGTVSLHGSLIEPNPKAKREARNSTPTMLPEQHSVAQRGVKTHLAKSDLCRRLSVQKLLRGRVDRAEGCPTCEEQTLVGCCDVSIVEA